MEPEYVEYITPDGQTFQFDTSTRWVMSEEGTGLPEISYITQRGPEQHGSTVIDFRLEPRVVQLVVREDTCNRWNYWSARRNLLNYIRPNRKTLLTPLTGRLRKYFPDGTKLDLNVVIESGPKFTAKSNNIWDEWAYQETLRFIAYDPVYFDPNQICVVWTVYDTNQLEFPIEFPILFGGNILYNILNVNYPGTWETFPTIEVYGPLQGILLENITTGKFIKILHVVSIGEVVTIYLQYGNKRIFSSMAGDITGTVTEDSDLLSFSIVPDPEAPGGVNQISVKGISADPLVTSVRMSYYVRYIGY